MAAKDLTAIEVWKDIPEYKGYQASNQGRIGSFWKQASPGESAVIGTDRRILKPRPTKRGYLKINLRHESGKIKTRFVHRLVLAAFAGLPPSGAVTCHKHGGRANNQVGNLRWSTQKSNLQDAGHKGTKKVLSQEHLDEMVRLAKDGMLGKDLAVRFGVARSCISRCLAREGFEYKRTYRPPRILSDDGLVSAVKLAKEGMTHRDIAKQLQVSRPTVTRWLSRLS